ncbi:MAG: lipoate--protein ligase, partial [Planctomycetes bacterium]|nr:lipoate--protein ligase [Planctomycetota bacterium]
SVLQQYQQGAVLDFHRFTEPVVAILRSLGVPAELTGRNDILAGGRKISGNAQFFTAHKMFSHGTLLFDSRLEDVVEALNPKMSKITSKGLKSIRSRVANISEFLESPMGLEEFRDRLIEGLFAEQGEIRRHRFTAEEWRAIHDLAETKYSTWEWNFGSSPAFNVQKVHRFPIGEIDARIDVQKGVVQSVRFFGDFFGELDVSELERLLVGVRYEPDDLALRLEGAEVGRYFGGVTRDELVAFLY